MRLIVIWRIHTVWYSKTRIRARLRNHVIGVLHKYHFRIPERSALNLLEVYHYEWN